MGIALQLEKELAFGLLAIGCSPGGGGSNIMTSVMDGDINLSIVMTFVSNIVALGTTIIKNLFQQVYMSPHLASHIPEAKIKS